MGMTGKNKVEMEVLELKCNWSEKDSNTTPGYWIEGLTDATAIIVRFLAVIRVTVA
jgi:hypothetical protein